MYYFTNPWIHCSAIWQFLIDQSRWVRCSPIRRKRTDLMTRISGLIKRKGILEYGRLFAHSEYVRVSKTVTTSQGKVVSSFVRDHRTGLQEPTTDSVISSAVRAKIIGFNRAPHEAQNRRCPAQNGFFSEYTQRLALGQKSIDSAATILRVVDCNQNGGTRSRHDEPTLESCARSSASRVKTDESGKRVKSSVRTHRRLRRAESWPKTGRVRGRYFH